jgi:bifunctional ADP-heptose synthase (sugar kinase/adenylyltransferase)
VWDLKHIAHDRYLEAAKDLVELLVVGVDTDEFTKARKKSNGPDRPIIPLLQRAEGISYLRSADLITKVTEDFVGLLKAVRPDVLIFSKTTTDLAEKKRQEYGEYAGRIELLEPQAPPEEVSTTARIKSIAEAALKQAEAAAHSALEKSFEELKKEL